MFDSDFSVGRILPNGGPCRSPPQALPVADPAPQRHRPPDPLGGRPRHGAPEGGRRVPGQPHHPRLRCAGGVIHPRARPPWVAGCSIWLQTDFYGRNVLQKFKKICAGLAFQEPRTDLLSVVILCSISVSLAFVFILQCFASTISCP